MRRQIIFLDTREKNPQETDTFIVQHSYGREEWHNVSTWNNMHKALQEAKYFNKHRSEGIAYRVLTVSTRVEIRELD